VYGRSMPFVWLIDIIGIAGATLTTLCWLPQALKVIREKETRALSLPATGAFTAGVILWLVSATGEGVMFSPLANVHCARIV
jgi:MtN3 and saliva related transmembrane protein